jgi:hypothetical protein
MSESPTQHALAGRGSLVRAGGALGIAGGIIGLICFFALCAGYAAVLVLSPLPALLGGVGLILSIIGGVYQRKPGVEDTHVLAAIFVTIFSLVGGLVLMGVWLSWDIMPR